MRAPLAPATPSHPPPHCRYKEAFDSHMLRSFLASLPPQQRKLEEESMIPRPNLDTFVFARVRETIGAFQVEEGCVCRPHCPTC